MQSSWGGGRSWSLVTHSYPFRIVLVFEERAGRVGPLPLRGPPSLSQRYSARQHEMATRPFGPSPLSVPPPASLWRADPLWWALTVFELVGALYGGALPVETGSQHRRVAALLEGHQHDSDARYGCL